MRVSSAKQESNCNPRCPQHNLSLLRLLLYFFRNRIQKRPANKLINARGPCRILFFSGLLPKVAACLLGDELERHLCATSQQSKNGSTPIKSHGQQADIFVVKASRGRSDWNVRTTPYTPFVASLNTRIELFTILHLFKPRHDFFFGPFLKLLHVLHGEAQGAKRVQLRCNCCIGHALKNSSKHKRHRKACEAVSPHGTSPPPAGTCLHT